MGSLVRLVVVLFVAFLLLVLFDRRVRGRTNRSRFVQIVVVSLVLIVFLVWMGTRGP